MGINKESNTFTVDTRQPIPPIVFFPEENKLKNVYYIKLDPLPDDAISWEYEYTLESSIIKKRENSTILSFQFKGINLEQPML